jgi:glyoxylase I family protein
MLNITSVHHIAIICSDYAKSKSFYTNILGFSISAEHFREERSSWKLDLNLHGKYTIELFSFPLPPQRITNPESTGLRHLAFEVGDLNSAVEWLEEKGVVTEGIRIDPYTGKRFTFFSDPDKLPLELYES